MKNAWIAGFVVAVSQAVAAGPINDSVIVGSQEWAQVNLFTNVSWNTLNTQCPGGVCSLTSAVNGYDLDGWTWASIDDVQALFNTFTGQAASAPSEYTQIDSNWGPIFTSVFTPTSTELGSTFVFGLTSTYISFGDVALALVNDSPAGLDTASTEYITQQENAYVTLGAWFVRAAPIEVPVPATLALFGLGLASMLMNRRKRGAKV